MEAASFVELPELEEPVLEEVRQTWGTLQRRPNVAKDFLRLLSEALPDTLHMSKRSTTVWRILDDLVTALSHPSLLRPRIEFVALRHLDVVLEAADLEAFKTLLVDTILAKLGSASEAFQVGMAELIAAVGKCMMATQRHYAKRVRVLVTSWRAVGDSESPEKDKLTEKKEDRDTEDRDTEIELTYEEKSSEKENEQVAEDLKGGEKEGAKVAAVSEALVPSTFAEMAHFNASVMGLGNPPWLSEIVNSMDALVLNIGNIARLQEECDVLSLLLWRHSRTEKVDLQGFQSVLFASLRSLLQKDWKMKHEEAWRWFWQCVEPLLEVKLPLGQYQSHLRSFMGSMDDEEAADCRLEIWKDFIRNCPDCQDTVKANNQRLSWLAGKILNLLTELFCKTHSTVRTVSALGLVHAGMGIPEDFVGIFQESLMGTVRKYSEEAWLPGLRWSSSLVSRMLLRTLAEGSTAVMKSISKDSARELRKAVASAPRRCRDAVLLHVQVGTESISPLLWAIESGALNTVRAIFIDLLTIRADRARYYYGMEALWKRHPDIVPVLCRRAPSLLHTLLDGLIWKSSKVTQGMRRVNYYVGPLLVDEELRLTSSIPELVKHSDPVVICHPCAIFVSDLLWSRICGTAFLYSKVLFVLSLLSFIIGFQHIPSINYDGPARFVVIGCRLFTYAISLGQLLAKHAYMFASALAAKDTCKYCCFPLPAYLARSFKDFVEVILVLHLLALLYMEPVLHCLQYDPWVLECCHFSQRLCDVESWHRRVSCIPMLLYFVLTSELIHSNIHLSCFVLLVASLWWDMFVYCCILAFLTASFASAMACLPQTGSTSGVQFRDFSSLPSAFQSLLSVSVKTYSANSFEEIATASEPLLAWFILAFAGFWHVFLMNLMVAQLCQRFGASFKDALGYARLKRGSNIFDTALSLISDSRWKRFIRSLNLDAPCPLDASDPGPRGGIPTLEEFDGSSGLPVQLFGGLASPSEPWPELRDSEESELDKFEKTASKRFDDLERLVADIADKLGGRRAGLRVSLRSSPRSSVASNVEDWSPGKRASVRQSQVLADSELEEPEIH